MIYDDFIISIVFIDAPLFCDKSLLAFIPSAFEVSLSLYQLFIILDNFFISSWLVNTDSFI